MLQGGIPLAVLDRGHQAPVPSRRPLHAVVRCPVLPHFEPGTFFSKKLCVWRCLPYQVMSGFALFAFWGFLSLAGKSGVQ